MQIATEDSRHYMVRRYHYRAVDAACSLDSTVTAPPFGKSL
jgi:hypothetical protein